MNFSRLRAFVALVFLGSFVSAAWTSGLQARSAEPIYDLPVQGVERLGAHFEAHPELKTTKSSGWKPYNREVWLQQTRPVPPGQSIAQLRYEVFQEAKRRLGASDLAGRVGWFSIGPVEYSGRCVSIDFHPTNPAIVFVGSAGGGLWKSIDGGDSWSASTDHLPTLAVGAVCVLASDPNTVLIGTGEGSGVGFLAAGKGIFGFGLLKSTDGGETWNETSLSYAVPSAHGFNVIEDNPTTGTILAGANDGLWRSTDDGGTWTLVMGNGNYFDVKWKPGDPQTVYVSKGRDPFTNSQADNGVFISTDDGLTFSLAGTGQPSGTSIAKTKIAVTPANPDYIYAHFVSSFTFGSIGVYRSTDGGQTWQQRNSLNMCGGQGFYNNVIMADPDNPERVIAGGTILYQSNSGGQNFGALNSSVPFGDEVSPHWDNHALVYEPGSTENVWVANDGGPWRSTDDGAIWTRRTAGIVSYQFYDIGVAQSNPLFVMGGTQDNGMPGRADEDSWFHSTFVADGFVCNVDTENADIVYSEWQGGNHIKSTDGGQTWDSIQSGISGSGSWLTPVDLDQNDGNHLFTASSTGIYRTTNGGTFWALVGSQDARWISMNPSDGRVVWTVSNVDGVFSSVNDGDDWGLSTSFPLTGLETKIQADPSDLDAAFVTVGGYATGGPHILRTNDRGQTWTDVTGNFPDQPANTMIVDPDSPSDWYVGSDVGVWKSTDGGATWRPYGVGLINALVTDLEIRREQQKLVAGTYGRGVWEADLPSVVVSADDSEGVEGGLVSGTLGNGSPNLMLDPPYPNPVAGAAVVRFAARSDAPVSLEVYDVSGRRLEALVADGRGDGLIRMISWSTSSLSDGVYFLKLRAGEERVTRKAVVRAR